MTVIRIYMPSLVESAATVLENNWKDYFTIPCEGLYPFQWNWGLGFYRDWDGRISIWIAPRWR